MTYWKCLAITHVTFGAIISYHLPNTVEKGWWFRWRPHDLLLRPDIKPDKLKRLSSEIKNIKIEIFRKTNPTTPQFSDCVACLVTMCVLCRRAPPHTGASELEVISQQVEEDNQCGAPVQLVSFAYRDLPLAALDISLAGSQLISNPDEEDNREG